MVAPSRRRARGAITSSWDRKALIQKRTHPRDPEGAEAVCNYRVVEEFRDVSLIEVRLETGKRNQIRIQARLRGHTLVGERRYVYGPGTLRPIDFPRQALHAYRLAFEHPVDGREMRFEAPLPDDFRRVARASSSMIMWEAADGPQSRLDRVCQRRPAARTRTL